jgi:serine/threonine-protein kinase HipA
LALAPFYDLMCTRIYPGLSGEFAFSIGGQVLPGQLGSVHILALAKDLKLSPAFVRRAAQTLADRLPQALHQAMADTRPSLHPAGQVFADKLARWVLLNTQKVVARTVEK